MLTSQPHDHSKCQSKVLLLSVCATIEAASCLAAPESIRCMQLAHHDPLNLAAIFS